MSDEKVTRVCSLIESGEGGSFKHEPLEWVVAGHTIAQSAVLTAKMFDAPGLYRVTGDGIDTTVNVVREVVWKAVELRKDCNDD